MPSIPRPLTYALIAYLAVLTLQHLADFAVTKSSTERVHVRGTGEVSAPPDSAVILLTVITEAAEPASAQAQNTERANAVFKMLEGVGVPAKDYRTTQYSLEPIYAYVENRPPQLKGFRLSQTVSVKLKNLDWIGRVLSESVTLGVNRTDGPTFEVADPKALEAQARQKAFADARYRAEQMAQAAGVRLGRVLSFSEGAIPMPGGVGGGRGGAMPLARAARELDAVEAPVIAPGTQEVSVSVDVIYEIR
jgi:uncharacterized protein YggE